MTIKEQVLEAITHLPGDADYPQIAEVIALLSSLAEAECDIEEGRLVSNEQMKARIADWSGGV